MGDEAESLNITSAVVWLRTVKPFRATDDLVDQVALRELHRRMFGQVWTWAGRIRSRETNLGVEPALIVERWEVLLRDTRAQIEHRSFPVEEIPLRLHRGMLAIGEC